MKFRINLLKYSEWYTVCIICFYIKKILFLNWCRGGGVQLGPLGIAATNRLLCQPRVIMMMEKLVE
jgi:hypothetical protein